MSRSERKCEWKMSHIPEQRGTCAVAGKPHAFKDLGGGWHRQSTPQEGRWQEPEAFYLSKKQPRSVANHGMTRGGGQS